MNITPLNTDTEGNCSCLKANYYKMGGANFLGHTKDGFKATCIMEMTNRNTHLNENQTEPLRIPQATKQGYIEFKGHQLKEGDGFYLGDSKQFFRGGLDGMSRSLKVAQTDVGVVQNYRIRKLTPRECFRLMGVTEADIDKIQQAGISNTRQYQLAGNSIVVDTLVHIFRKMFVDTGQESQQLSLF